MSVVDNQPQSSILSPTVPNEVPESRPVKIFVSDDDHDSKAVAQNLVENLNKIHQVEINACNCSSQLHDCRSVTATRNHYRTCQKVKRQCYRFSNKFQAHNVNWTTDVENQPQDVVIVLGHSREGNMLLTEYIDRLVLYLTEIKPTIVAFLMCCGGNMRYGPVLKLSHLLTGECTPIIGFYQRRVYVNELLHTSLLIGVQYYLGMVKPNDQPQTRKQIARQAFGLATTPQYSGDPTVFVNDSPIQSFVQSSCQKYKMRLEDVPLSCMQLTICNSMIAGSEAIVNVDQEETYSKSKFDVWCNRMIIKRQIHKLIPLICEIELLKLYENTLEKMKNGDGNSWKEIDHLQFLIAVLRGHWGMNSLAVIKEWATFHLMEMMRKIKPQKEFSVHRVQKLSGKCHFLISFYTSN